MPNQGGEAADLVKLADAGLYQAKPAGRNRFETVGCVKTLLAANARFDPGATARNRVLRMLGSCDA